MATPVTLGDDCDAMETDRAREIAIHPRVRPNGWSPPYEARLRLLHAATEGSS